MSEKKKKETDVEKKEEGKTTVSASEAALKAVEAAEAAELAQAQAKAAAEQAAQAEAEAEKALEKEFQEDIADAKEETPAYTNKRGAERIFRREKGEPEFFLYKKDLKPTRPVLTEDEEKEISRKVEIPTDQTPQYTPERMLSPEYAGISNYEIGVKNQKEELEQRLARLKNDPNSSSQEINQAEEDLKTLDYLYENYHLGMNIFRTAKGGRDKVEK